MISLNIADGGTCILLDIRILSNSAAARAPALQGMARGSAHREQHPPLTSIPSNGLPLRERVREERGRVKGLDEVAYVSVVPIVADIFGCSNCQSLVDSSDGTVTGREGLRDRDLRGSLTIISCGINSPNDPGAALRGSESSPQTARSMGGELP